MIGCFLHHIYPVCVGSNVFGAPLPTITLNMCGFFSVVFPPNITSNISMISYRLNAPSVAPLNTYLLNIMQWYFECVLFFRAIQPNITFNFYMFSCVFSLTVPLPLQFNISMYVRGMFSLVLYRTPQTCNLSIQV